MKKWLCITILVAGCTAQPVPQPVIVQAPTPAPTPKVIPPDPYTKLPTDVVQAIKHNETPTLHHGITTVFPYSPDQKYQLNCQPLHVTQIRLRDDESTDKNNVQVGDKERWGILIGQHSVKIFPLGTNVSITVPNTQVIVPPDPKMITNLAIHTDKGNDYTFDPVKIGKPFTEKVEFYYPDYIKQLDAERKQEMK